VLEHGSVYVVRARRGISEVFMDSGRNGVRVGR